MDIEYSSCYINPLMKGFYRFVLSWLSIYKQNSWPLIRPLYLPIKDSSNLNICLV